MNQTLNCYPALRQLQLIADGAASQDAVVDRAAQMFADRIARRCACAVTRRPAAYTLTLALDPAIGSQGFRIHSDAAGATIAGSCSLLCRRQGR